MGGPSLEALAGADAAAAAAMGGSPRTSGVLVSLTSEVSGSAHAPSGASTVDHQAEPIAPIEAAAGAAGTVAGAGAVAQPQPAALPHGGGQPTSLALPAANMLPIAQPVCAAQPPPLTAATSGQPDPACVQPACVQPAAPSGTVHGAACVPAAPTASAAPAPVPAPAYGIEDID